MRPKRIKQILRYRVTTVKISVRLCRRLS